MEVKWIDDPSPVWEGIKEYMIDDEDELISNGKFIGVFDHSVMVGAFLVKPWSTYCYELHGGVAKECFGRGEEICRAMGMSIFQTTPCLKIVCMVPEYNKPMRECLKRCGLKREGVVKGAFLRHMKIHDLYIYGIQRREVFKWLQ